MLKILCSVSQCYSYLIITDIRLFSSMASHVLSEATLFLKNPPTTFKRTPEFPVFLLVDPRVRSYAVGREKHLVTALMGTPG